MTTLLTTGSAHGLGLPTLFEAVALGVHLKDVNAVSETIQQGAGMRAEFCPCGSRWGYAPSGVASETFGRVLSHGLSGKAAESFVLCHVSPDALEGGLERWVGLEWLGGRRRLPYLDLAQCREGGVIGHVPMCAPVDHGRDACAREARPLNQLKRLMDSRSFGRRDASRISLQPGPAVASRQVSAELCRVGGGSTRGAGRPTGSATRRAYRRLPASTSTAQCPAQLRHADRAHGWSQPLHQRCHQEVGGRGGVNGHNARSGQTPRRCRPQRRRKSSQDCDSAIQKAHPTSDGEMEGGPEGEAQGAVHPWDRPGTEHTQRHREEVHECRKPTHVARPRNVGSALVASMAIYLEDIFP